jgi:hypothetical protein
MSKIELPKFLVMRFAPGSAGNFLTSLLQCSDGIGHWDEHLERNKSDTDWLKYFQEVYVSDLSQWLNYEPLNRQNLGVREIFSAIYERGNYLSIDQFAEQEKKHCTDFYFDLKSQQKYIPVFWQKNYFPEYFANATFINIMLDGSSLRWFDRSFYKKHFFIDTVNADGSLIVRYERHRPSIVPRSFVGNNDYLNYHPSFTDFAKKEIFSNPWRSRYLGREYLQGSSNGRPEYTLTLSDLLDIKKLKPQYANLCKFLNITPMPTSLLLKLFAHWRQCHDY